MPFVTDAVLGYTCNTGYTEPVDALLLRRGIQPALVYHSVLEEYC